MGRSRVPDRQWCGEAAGPRTKRCRGRGRHYGFGRADFLRRAVVFGCVEGALTFAFHTGDVTDPAASEYRVYLIPRHCGPEPICESSEDWLCWVHKGYDPATWGDSDEDDEGDSLDPRLQSDTMPYARSPVQTYPAE